MEQVQKKKLKWFFRIILILFMLAIGFAIVSGMSTRFLLNYFKDIHAGNVYGQISYLMLLHEGLAEEAREDMDEQLIYNLYSFTTSAPKGLPEDVSKWNASTLTTWQRAKEYYEHYPELLEGQSEQNDTVREILEKVPDSDRRIREKQFAKQHTGKAAPDLDVSEWIGQSINLDQLKGKVVLLDFWGNWCGPCLRRIPRMQELHYKYEDKGLAVIGIHSERDSQKAAEFMSENNYTFTTGLDTGQTAENYSIQAWPSYFLIDKQGRLAWGPEHFSPPVELIESLLAK